MLKNTYEWLRAADFKPNDQVVANRTQAAQELLSRIKKSEDYDLLTQCVAGVVGGFENRFTTESSTVQTVVDCIRTFQAAFPAGLSENALELRICCALSVGELFAEADSGASGHHSLVGALLLVAGLGARPPETRKHLADVFSELGQSARQFLQGAQIGARERPQLNWKQLDSLTPANLDLATFWGQFLPALKQVFAAVEQQGQMDREELEVLWWLYNGTSERLGGPIRSLPASVAAFAIGREVADRVIPPSLAGVGELVSHAVARDRTSAQLKAKPLGRIVADLDEPSRKLLLPTEEQKETRALIRNSAPSLPLSWLCLRLEESGGATGWESEFRTKTDLQADQEFTPAQLASQSFNERVAQRVYAQLVEE